MRNSFFTKVMSFALMIVLAVGQGAAAIAMPMPMQNGGQMPMMATMAGMDMSASTTNQSSKDCCGHSDNGKAMKGGMCAACCAATAQAAMLPVQSFFPVQYAVSQTYEAADATVTNRTPPPEPPPPKA